MWETVKEIPPKNKDWMSGQKMRGPIQKTQIPTNKRDFKKKP
jgi:hypothetical protein